jgi:hypothetical protein
MPAWCCSNSDHPNDWWCANIFVRSVCTDDSGSSTGNPTITASGSTGGGGNQLPELTDLAELDRALNERTGSPTLEQLVELGSALQAAGFHSEMETVSNYVERNISPTEYELVSKVYRIRSESLLTRNNIDAAKTALDIAHDFEKVAMRQRILSSLSSHKGRRAKKN